MILFVREKKKLAPSCFCWSICSAMVRATVDFPIPAMPLSQKIGDGSWAGLLNHFRTSSCNFSRVPGKHRESALIELILYAAYAFVKEDKRVSIPQFENNILDLCLIEGIKHVAHFVSIRCLDF